MKIRVMDFDHKIQACLGKSWMVGGPWRDHCVFPQGLEEATISGAWNRRPEAELAKLRIWSQILIDLKDYKDITFHS